MTPPSHLPAPVKRWDEGAIRFRVLGAVSLVSGDTAALQARRSERLLLGILALEPGRWLGVDRLAQLLWGDRTPKDPRRTLQVYVSRLRPQLPAPLVFQANAYNLDTSPESVDAQVFTNLVSTARDRHDPAERVDLLQRALELWRGPVFGDAADDTLRARLGIGLEQLRLTAVQLKLEAELELGNHELLLPDLAQWTTDHPSNERFVAAHMTALHRSGRTEEALNRYRRYRDLMVDEYGLDPAADLERLHLSLLRGEADPPPAAPADVRPAQLPPGTTHFVGRDEAWRGLCSSPVEATDRPRLIVIDGMVGTGKTALAVRFGHATAEKFPDGCLFLDLHGFTEGAAPVQPLDALDHLLRSLGVTDRDLPPDLAGRAAELRSRLAARRLVLVLDNAADTAQIEPLIPAGPGCLVVITSRRSLSGLDHAEHITLPPLSQLEADRLFQAICPRTDISADTVSEITRRCGLLPLAIRNTAILMQSRPQWTAEHLLDRLRRLRDVAGADDGLHSVTSALSVSHRDLSEPSRRMFRLLALTPAVPFDVECAAALADVTVERADELLTELTDARMVEPHESNRYRLHDLYRRYAEKLVHQHEPASKHRAALRRLVHHCLAVARTATYRLEPDRVRLTADRECPNPVALPSDEVAATARLDVYRAMIRHIIQIGHIEELHDQVARMCEYLTPFYRRGWHIEDWLFTHELGGVSAERIGDTARRTQLMYHLAEARELTGDFDRAVAGYRLAADQFTLIEDTRARVAALNSLGSLYVRMPSSAALPDPVATGTGCLETALHASRRTRDSVGEAVSLTGLAEANRTLGRTREALDQYRAALGLLGDATGSETSRVLVGIGDLQAHSGDTEAARITFESALQSARRSGVLPAVCTVLERLAALHLRLTMPGDAHARCRELVALLPEPSSVTIPAAARMRRTAADTFEAMGLSTEAAEQRRLADRH